MNMGGERAEKELAQSLLEEAVAMTAWFPDYLFEMTDQPGKLPRLTIQRLKRQFGHSDDAGLRLICDEISMFSSDVQPDIAAYICGFPEEDLDIMLQEELQTVIDLLDERFPPALPVVINQPIATQPKVQPKLIPKPARVEVRKVNAVPILMDEEAQLPSVRSEIGYGVTDSYILKWQNDALCAQTDPEAFFPEKGGSTRDAKAICRLCESRQECLEYALSNEERFGIWGGLSERERRKLRRTAQG